MSATSTLETKPTAPSAPAVHLVHSTGPVVPRDRLIPMPEVERIAGIKKTVIYDLMGRGQFPRSVRLSARAVRWSEASVHKWVQERLAQGAAQ